MVDSLLRARNNHVDIKTVAPLHFLRQDVQGGEQALLIQGQGAQGKNGTAHILNAVIKNLL